MVILKIIKYGKKNGLIKTINKCFEKINGCLNPFFVRHCPFKINNKKIIFSNFNGKGYGYDPKYICDELIKKDGFLLYWVTKDKQSKESLPKGVKSVHLGSLKYYYHMATSKVWIDDVRKGSEICKRPGQYYLQTWHGFIPLKKIEKDVIHTLSKNYVEDAIHDSQLIDVILSSSETRSRLIRRAFWYDGEIMEVGCPRNDIFFHHDIKDPFVYKTLGIENTKRLAIYAPTFRQDGSIDAYNLDFDKVKKALCERFCCDFTWIVRLHPNLEGIDIKQTFGTDVVDGSIVQDAQWLFANVDILISDYSDCLFEAALGRIPVFIYASDIDSYMKERDFYTKLTDLPFSISKNNDEMIFAVTSFDDKEYYKKLDDFWITQGLFEKGDATKKIVKWVIEKTM